MKNLLALFVRAAAVAVLLAAGGAPAQQAAPVAPTTPATSAVQPNRAPHPAPEQPLPFSHKTHVSMGLQCLSCHTNPAPGKQMTFPATSTCMTCHATMATDRPAIQKLTEYANTNQTIPWVRVYKVLPGVSWTHARHLQAGAQCETCHGPVGESQAMAQTTAVTSMASCVSCHQARNVSATCATCHAWPAK